MNQPLDCQFMRSTGGNSVKVTPAGFLYELNETAFRGPGKEGQSLRTATCLPLSADLMNKTAMLPARPASGNSGYSTPSAIQHDSMPGFNGQTTQCSQGSFWFLLAAG